jgi:hypothetical protein
MSDVKYIKGQVWIAKNGDKESLVQDQIMVVPGVDSVSNVIAIVDDIWADLLSESGTYKTNNRGYFYWEYRQTLVDNPDLEITVQFECPKPKPGLFKEPYDPSTVQGDYAKYWVNKLKIAADNFEYGSSIQKKEIVFPKSEYLNWKTGKIEEVDEVRIKNDDLGDIENLLGLMF